MRFLFVTGALCLFAWSSAGKDSGALEKHREKNLFPRNNLANATKTTIRLFREMDSFLTSFKEKHQKEIEEAKDSGKVDRWTGPIYDGMEKRVSALARDGINVEMDVVERVYRRVLSAKNPKEMLENLKALQTIVHDGHELVSSFPLDVIRPEEIILLELRASKILDLKVRQNLEKRILRMREVLSKGQAQKFSELLGDLRIDLSLHEGVDSHRHLFEKAGHELKQLKDALEPRNRNNDDGGARPPAPAQQPQIPRNNEND